MSQPFPDRIVATLKLGGRSAGRSLEPIHFKLKSIDSVTAALQFARFDASASVQSDGGPPQTAELFPIPRSTTTLPRDTTSLPRRGASSTSRSDARLLSQCDVSPMSPSDASSACAYQPGTCCCN
jgi:hypothetical protein